MNGRNIEKRCRIHNEYHRKQHDRSRLPHIAATCSYVKEEPNRRRKLARKLGNCANTAICRRVQTAIGRLVRILPSAVGCKLCHLQACANTAIDRLVQTLPSAGLCKLCHQQVCANTAVCRLVQILPSADLCKYCRLQTCAYTAVCMIHLVVLTK